MAELGGTQDPAALVPGNPEAIEENARVVRARAQRAGSAAEGLQAIDTGSWLGPAAQAFHDKFSYEPAKWFAASDALESGASVLEDYAATLRWAQSQAAEAITRWNQGQAATRQALAEQANAADQPAAPFTDPGEPDRQAARDILDRARWQLHEAGDLAAATLREATEGAPRDSSWIDDLGHTLAQAGADVLNAAASFGNAMLHHPLDVAEAVAGAGLTVVSAAGEGVGFALDATGVGAVAGVPLNAVAAAGVATGAGMVVHAATNLAGNAAGDDHVEPARSGGDPASGAKPGGGRPVSRENLNADQQANLKRYEKKLPAGAEDTRITQLEDGSLQFEARVPGRVSGSSATYTKIVAEDGTTVGYTKTTTLPDGSIAHVKDKMPK
ncbi:putative T7SS-secreted protein [Amycolatopsis dongchuanensis]|uniref:Putative T7SS secretion signal domain-containing protein n=1 Tax=Amycolatopsis dongchuanensis TaxID=1070866 RepID=A0ABP8VQ12_9PSEU